MIDINFVSAHLLSEWSSITKLCLVQNTNMYNSENSFRRFLEVNNGYYRLSIITKSMLFLLLSGI